MAQLSKYFSKITTVFITNLICNFIKRTICCFNDSFVFPNAGSMDLKNSSPQLCPFLMPPITRMMWVLQERVWEGLDPLPLYASGQCDDVGLDCDGWGRVVIEARIMKPEEVKSLEKQ